jgi:hypothetical protein
MYNALDGPSLWHGDWQVRIGEAHEGQIQYELGVFNLGNARAGVEMDLRALSGQAALRRSVRMVGDQRFVFAGFTQAGGRLEAWIDLTQPVPYSRLLAALPKGGALELERLTANQAIPRQRSSSPRSARKGWRCPPRGAWAAWKTSSRSWE